MGIVLGTMLSHSVAGRGDDHRPNILWIVADDLSPDLGCYGTPHVSTPNVDRLASAGVRYTSAFATSPVCSPARTALITGMYQTTIGGHHHRTRNKPELPDSVLPVTELFRRAGYFVCNMGGPSGGGRAKTDYNFEHGELYDGNDWSGRRPGQPFFAQLQIKEPHRTFLTDDDPDRWQKIEVLPQYPDHPVTRRDWANYLASIEVMDVHVGEVLDRLESEELADDTIVLFLGDHGRPHVWGKQWLYEGGIQIPLIIRWPGRIEPGTVSDEMVSMIDFAPTTLVAAGLPIPEAMQGVDVFADEFTGRDAIFAARDRCGDAVDRIRCVRTDRFKYIRNFFPDRPYTQLSGYKKLQYPVLTLLEVLHTEGMLTPPQSRFLARTRPAEELYDLTVDPHELHNLVDDPQYAEALAELRARLNDWIEATGDRGGEPEGDNEFFRDLMEEKRQYYERTMQRRGLDADVSPADYLEWWAGELGVPKSAARE